VKDELLTAIAERMNRLDEVGVTWDRCVLHDATGVAYGWIDRGDGRSDFVVLQFQWGETKGLAGETLEWLAVGDVTSSAAYSERIAELTIGSADNNHKDCERVEDVFGALVNNKVKSKAAA
jgi:hypothetical protein